MKTTISYPTEAGMGKTGSWRVFRPVFRKGCGVCANVCPTDAIEMRREEK